jgi:hypothetical protein
MDLPHQHPSDVGWLHQAGARVRKVWLAKMLGTTFGMTVFFVVYFQLLRHPLYPPTIVPFTAVDRLIGFRPEALPLYLSLWFYVSLAPALLINRRELVSYGLAAIALSVIGLGIFLFWPTAVPRPDVDWSQHPAFAFLKSVDASGNACPSLHVAFAVRSTGCGAWASCIPRSPSVSMSRSMFSPEPCSVRPSPSCTCDCFARFLDRPKFDKGT